MATSNSTDDLDRRIGIRIVSSIYTKMVFSVTYYLELRNAISINCLSLLQRSHHLVAPLWPLPTPQMILTVGSVEQESSRLDILNMVFSVTYYLELCNAISIYCLSLLQRSHDLVAPLWPLPTPRMISTVGSVEQESSRLHILNMIFSITYYLELHNVISIYCTSRYFISRC